MNSLFHSTIFSYNFWIAQQISKRKRFILNTVLLGFCKLFGFQCMYNLSACMYNKRIILKHHGKLIRALSLILDFLWCLKYWILYGVLSLWINLFTFNQKPCSKDHWSWIWVINIAAQENPQGCKYITQYYCVDCLLHKNTTPVLMNYVIFSFTNLSKSTSLSKLLDYSVINSNYQVIFHVNSWFF